MAKKTKTRKMMNRLRKAASPTRVALMGALGGAAVMFFGRDRLRAGIDQLRTHAGHNAHAAE